MTTPQCAWVQADGCKVFYRYAGSTDPRAPTVVLLHGFPSSSFMYRNLLPLLAKHYRVLAPDLPGFGFTEVPPEREYRYTFANLCSTFTAWVDALGLQRMALFIFDYGAPTGLRFALRRPEAVAAVVTQNGNAYAEGLGRPFWDGLEQYWRSGAGLDRDALRPALERAVTVWQYTDGSPHPERVPPEGAVLDQALMDRWGNKEIQLDIFYDYRKNVELYPKFHEFFRDSGVPVLAVWGKNDTIFVSPGAEAYRRDVRDFELHYLDAGHFAVETNEEEIAGLMHNFFEKYYVFKP